MTCCTTLHTEAQEQKCENIGTPIYTYHLMKTSDRNPLLFYVLDIQCLLLFLTVGALICVACA